MTPDEVLALARAAAERGCREALFTVGDKPELRYAVARSELESLGFKTTVAYVAHLCRLVLDEAGLLPHANVGVVSGPEIAMLRASSVSLGLMLESTSERLCARGGPHFGSPDKEPARRLEVLRLAGEHSVAVTTGLLVGIGETRAERIETLLAIRQQHEQYGHIQEVIIQNFRAKPGTLMAAHLEPNLGELLWTIAVARLLLDPSISVQAPPNLSGSVFPRLLDAGINDWGGVSPISVDHVNPEAPWPKIATLADTASARGFSLVPRLPIYPAFIAQGERWLDPAVARHVRRLADATGLARDDHWVAGESRSVPGLPRRSVNVPITSTVSAAIRKSEGEQELSDSEIEALFEARGNDLAAVIAAADELRQSVCGNAVTYVVTRNINYTNVCYFRCGFCAFSKGKLADNLRGAPYLIPIEEILRRCREAWDRGAVEVCLQGGIHPGFTGDFYLDLCHAIKREIPDLHIHAFSALEVWQGAATLGLGLREYLSRLREAGLGSLPGTAAEILDDEIRAIICPDKVSTEQWLEVHRLAHEAGLRSTCTVMYGHTESPCHWARHLRRVRDLHRETGGFTEFVPLPFVHMEAPIYLRGNARPGPTFREAILMHSVARLALHPWITNIQASWVKLGFEGTRAALEAGANDVGGTLMNESIVRAARGIHGEEASPEQLESLIRRAGRVPAQRTTLYGEPRPERVAASYGAAPLAKTINPKARESGLPRRHELLRPVQGRDISAPGAAVPRTAAPVR